MDSCIGQLYIILWKNVNINQIRRQVVWTFLELAFTVIALCGIGKDSLEPRFCVPDSEAFAHVQPLQHCEHTATKIIDSPDMVLLGKVGALTPVLRHPYLNAIYFNAAHWHHVIA
ncbi:hypothetical protein MTO96_033560 [Rhipicephalus appendiculatus]